MGKITSYAALTVTPRSDDVVPIVDVHDTSMATSGTTKKISVATLGAVRWANVVQYGADPTGSADCTSAINSAVSSLPATGGVVYFPAGTYRVNSTVTVAMVGTNSIRFQGDGMQASIINYYGTGDCVRMYASSWSGTHYSQGSGMVDLGIDGSNASAGAAGLHVGDINGLYIENFQVQNFTGSGSIGIHFENTVNWTEQATVRAITAHNQTQVVFGLSGTGTVSYGYGDFDFTTWEGGGSGHDGVSLTGGAEIYHGRLRIRGNYNTSSSSLSNCVLRMAGGSTIASNHLQIQVESNNTGSTGFTAKTIIMDSSSQILGCYGIMDFSFGGSGTQFTPASLNQGQCQFWGVISGDTSLAPASYDVGLWANTSRPSALVADGYHGSGFPTSMGDMFTLTLSSSITANVTSTFFDGTKTLGIAQRVTIIITQAASGGPYTVTWPHNGSPTTGSPTVKWAGGSAPTMTATANAVDVYKLETTDGITWYGQAIQNVS